MKTLKKKFSIYQSSQKVRKLWIEYVEGRSEESRDTGIAGDAAIVGVVGPSSLSLLAPGQGAGRALRAFVDAVDLSDAKQAVVLQNLDDGGHGELVDTLLALAGALMGAGLCRGSFRPGQTDIALAEKSLKLVETCITGNSKPKWSRDWKALLRQLLAILACDTGRGDGLGHTPVDVEKTSVGRGTVDVKASALRVLQVVAADHERVVEVGRCTGFQTIARLALPQGSTLSCQATATIAHLLIASESDRARSPTTSGGSHRARTGRWGRVSRFGNGSRTISDSRSRVSSECSGRGGEWEEEGHEAGVGSSSSSSSLAGAASFVYSSFQALVGRESGALSSCANTEFAVSKIVPMGHPPMAVLRESLREEAARVAALGTMRSPSSGDGLSVSAMDKVNEEGEVGSSTAAPDTNGLAKECSAVTGNSSAEVAEMMLAQGVLAVLVDVIAPPLDAVDAEAGKGDGTTGTIAVSWTRTPEIVKATGAQLDALEATVSILEGRPQAQAEFISRGGFSRWSRLMHSVAASEFIQQPQPCDAGDSTDCDRHRGRSAPRSGSVGRRQELSPCAVPRALDATFDALVRLAINGRSVLPEARADGLEAVSALLTLAARSPSVNVTLRAARSLQALLRVRPLNAVIVERYNALGLLADAAADLVFPRVHTTCGGVLCGTAKSVCDPGDAEAVGAGRIGWSAEEKREVLSTLNEVVRMLAAVYSRQDARALERYAGIMSEVSSARFSDGPYRKLGSQCSSCGTAAARAMGTSLRRCLVEGCSGARGLCIGCDARCHHEVSEGSHVRVPLSWRRCEESRLYTNSSHSRPDPAWAVEGGKALLKALVAMLDDRESFGLPPTAEAMGTSADTVDAGDGVKEQTPGSSTGVLTALLCIVQDELLAPSHMRAELDNHTAELEQNPTARRTTGEGVAGENARDIANTTKSRESGSRYWTDGWLLGALEVVARLVVRGDDAMVEELGAAGGWGLLAHITCLSAPPGESPSSTLSSTQKTESSPGAGQANGRKLGFGRTVSPDPGEQLWETWLGWVGARRLALWILREALLTGAGQQRSREKVAGALTQPARWLVWLVQNLMTTDLPCTGCHKRISARDESLMRFAVLNELRLAIGSFAPCEVVMQGCTRVLPLVALSADRAESADSDVSGDSSRRVGVSPNRHPQAQSGAPNVKVVGRLAGDQRGVVLDTLVSEGLDEALLAVVGSGYGENTSSSSSGVTKAESSLALLCLAELAAGSEKAKARLGSTLGYDRVAMAAHGASVAMHAQQFSLWLEASVRRLGSGKARLPPPFLRVLTDTRQIPHLTEIESANPGGSGELSLRRQGDAGREALANDQDSDRGRAEVRGGRRRSWRKRSPRGKSNPGVKDGMTWVPHALPKLPLALSRGTGGPEDEDVDAVGTGSFGKRHERNGEPSANACLFDELWLPPGLLTLAQDVLLINRTRGVCAVRGEERYFIAQAGGAETATGSASGASLWRPVGAKFRGLEAAVFPFLLLPLIPLQYQPQAAGQLSRLLDANPANAAAMCFLRTPLALLKLACRLPDQSHVRDLYFRLAAQLMSHHMSPADAMELFQLASLQPSAWARLGRLQVASSPDLIQGVDRNRQRLAQGSATVDGGRGEQVRVQGHVDDDVALPPHSGELQMQLLYVIATVVEAPAPPWFFHMDGGIGSGLVAGPLPRFPSQGVGYSLSVWLRPALFSGGVGGETMLFSLSGKTEEGAQKLFLRVSLRRCQRPGDVPALRAAAGIGANEDDDHDNATDDGSAVVEISASVDSTADQRSEPVRTGEHSATRIGVVRDPEVRCGRWQHLIITHTNESAPSSSAAAGPWPAGCITVYIDGEQRTVSTAGVAGKSMLSSVDPQVPAYPVAGSGLTLSASVGCDEDRRQETSAAASTMAAPAAGKSPARFNGQIATVALVERAWTTEMAKVVFLRGPGAAPPGKRIIYTEPGDLPPTPFLDSPRDDEMSSSGNQTSLSGDGVQVRGASSIDTEGAVAEPEEKGGEARFLDCRDHGPQATEEIGDETGPGLDTCDLSESESTLSSLPRPSNEAATLDLSTALARQSNTCASSGTLWYGADVRDPPRCRAAQLKVKRKAGAKLRLSVLFTPLRRAIDSKYGIVPDNLSSEKWSSAGAGALDNPSADGTATVASATGGGDVSMTVSSLAVAAGCGGSKESKADARLSFKLAGRGTWVYATTPLHAAVQAAGGFRLCLPFLRMDHARQVAALRVLAGLLEASTEGMDAFRVRDGFNVLYHALAQGDDAIQQLSMDSFDTLFELMTSEALQGAVDVPPSSLSSVSFLDATGGGGDADGGYGDGGLAGVKPVRSPEALRLVVDLVGHCERAAELQAKVMEALVDALDGSSTGIQVWRRAFNESGAFAPLLYLLSPPTYAYFEGEHDCGTEPVAGVSTRSPAIRRVPSFLSSSASGAVALRDDVSTRKWVSSGERPAVAAGPAARTQAIRMLQVLIAGSAGVAPVVRPQDPTAAVASSTSAGCTPEQLSILVGFVLRCHLEAEELVDMVRREMLNTGQEDSWGTGRDHGSRAAPGSTALLLALTRRVGGTVLDLLVQLCGGDGGAVVVGMMSMAFPGGGHFFVPLELMSSSHVDTRVSAIKLLSLMLVRKGDDGRRPSTSGVFSSEEIIIGGRPGPDPRALRTFEKLGGFAAMCHQLEMHTACQAVCDALMGMIFGVWGSKHEPRPIRERDVLAIKGNKESWLRAWWRDYSSSPDDEPTNPTSSTATVTAVQGQGQGQPAAGEGSSLVDRLLGAAVAPPAVPTSSPLPSQHGGDGGDTTVQTTAPSETVASTMDEVAEEAEQEDKQQKSCAKGDTTDMTLAEVDPCVEGETADAAKTTECTPIMGEEHTLDTQAEVSGVVKPGRFAALLKAVEAHNAIAPLRSEAAVHAAMLAPGGSGGVDKGDKEETGFLSGFFKRLSLDHAGGDNTGTRTDSAVAAAKIVPPTVPTVPAVSENTVSAVSKAVPGDDNVAEAGPAEPTPGRPVAVPTPLRTERFVEEDQPEKVGTGEENGYHAAADAGGGESGGDGSGGGDGGGSSGAEVLNVVLPQAVEVLMRVLQRAPNPAILARPLLQLESAVAWLPLSAAEGYGPGRNTTSRRDFGNNRGGGDGDDGEGGSRSNVGKGSGGGGGSSGTSGVGVGRGRGKVGSDRERNADSLMSRQGWLAWCCRLVDALGARNDCGDLVQGRASIGYGGADGDIGGSERWGAGGSEASEAGGYLDDSHSETTDTGSAFSYYESSSMGRSLAQEGGAMALEAFTGPVYGLVAALLEQDMARAPRDKRGHRFLDLFSLAAADAFQAAVLEGALDGIQDSPMLSSNTRNNAQQQQQELSPGRGGAGAGGGGLSGDGGSDGSVRRLESLRELLSAALDRKPDLPLALCVKSVHTINLLGYHNTHEARNWMKNVGLLGVRDDLIRRCLFHPTASPAEQVSALSQVEDALETLVSQPGKSAGEVESSLAGEVAVQLMHLFTQATTNAANPLPPATATGTGPPSPLVRSNTATNAARATQIAAARALGRAAAASAVCRSTVIRLARDPQLLARLLPALRCPLTAEEMEAIELGNIPDAAPTLTTGSRWSIGSLNLLPSATASTSCMSDDAEDDDPETGPRSAVTTNQQPSPTHTNTNGSTNTPTRAFFPTTSTPSANTAGPRPPSLHQKGSSSLGTSGGNLSGFPDMANGLSGSGPAGVTGGSSSQFRLDEVLEDVEEEDGAHDGENQTETDEGVALGTESGVVVEGEPGGVWSKSPVRMRGRRRSSSDLSAGSLGSVSAAFGNGGGGAAAGVPRTRAGQSVGGSSWHGPINGGRSAGPGGGWGVPEHDLHAFVRWYNGEERRGMREGVRRRVSTALAPLDKARVKAAAKHAAKREKAVRQAQKREAEAAAVKEKAANDALERCRAHAERAADRTSATVDNWLAERRRRWEAGRTRCEELAPPAGGTWGGVGEGGAPGGAIRGPKHTVRDAAVIDGRNGSDGPGGGRGQRGVASALRWDWAKRGGEGLSFEDFFETFAGGDVHRSEEEEEEAIGDDDDRKHDVVDDLTRSNDSSVPACDR